MTQLTPETILPYNDKESKSSQVRRMFNHIAEHYDRLNHTLSFGTDRNWRRDGIAYLKPFHPSAILDIATGTGDLAIEMARRLAPTHITGADISEKMMDVGREKVRQAGLQDAIAFDLQDCLSLTYPEASFDAVTAAFGVRNFGDIEQGLREMYRILKPGGHIMILELSTPEHFPMRQLYHLYSRLFIPFVGRLVSGEGTAYQYLPASIRVVPQGQRMCQKLSDAGFSLVKARTFTFGVCSMYTGEKQKQQTN